MNLGDWMAPIFVVGIPVLFWIMLAMYGKESARQSQDRRTEDNEIQRRAAAGNRILEPRTGDEIWRQKGSLRGGEPWTLSYFNDSLRDAPRPTTSEGYIGNEWLVLRCQGLEQGGDAFALRPRTRAGTQPGETALEGDLDLRRRWVLFGGNEPLARRAFGAATCALLERLPPDPFGFDFDERSAITLNRNGLVATLACSGLTANLVDLWIEICETLGNEIRSP